MNSERLNIAQNWMDKNVLPHANDWDRNELIPAELITRFAEHGWLGATISEAYGGLGMSQQEYGRLSEITGAACSSLRSLLTVHHDLFAQTLEKWGTDHQKETWLPPLCKGEKIAAFAISEPEVGSDAKSIKTAYEEKDGAYVLNGVKKWITFGGLADVFVICAAKQTAITAFIVEKDQPGVEVVPLKGISGTRASQLAEIRLNNVHVHPDRVLGRPGFGFLQIINTALDNGRYSVACGSAGIAKAALTQSIAYANERTQYGSPLIEHQLIRQKITKMTAWTRTAQLLCLQAGKLRDEKDPDAMVQTTLAKYVSGINARKAANEAMQLHGAVAFEETHNIQRLYRDSKVMEIIEGSNEMQELLIADYAKRNVNCIIS